MSLVMTWRNVSVASAAMTGAGCIAANGVAAAFGQQLVASLWLNVAVAVSVMCQNH